MAPASGWSSSPPRAVSHRQPPPPGKPPKELTALTKVQASASRRLHEALNDDLNTPVALAVLADVAKAANELCDLAAKRRKDKRFVAACAPLATTLGTVFRSLTDVLGLLQSEAAVYQARTRAQRLGALGKTEADIEARIHRRTQARADKDFATADAVRQELESLGVELSDSPAGTTWRVAVQ